MVIHYPGLYAGATDLVGVYDYEDSIIDFKQSNKPKRKEWIDDYFMQLGAYAMAHNYVYQTEDREDGLFYRFTPKDKSNLYNGGKLQFLSLKDFRGVEGLK